MDPLLGTVFGSIALLASRVTIFEYNLRVPVVKVYNQVWIQFLGQIWISKLPRLLFGTAVSLVLDMMDLLCPDHSTVDA
jgi:hypothetical protein